MCQIFGFGKDQKVMIDFDSFFRTVLFDPSVYFIDILPLPIIVKTDIRTFIRGILVPRIVKESHGLIIFLMGKGIVGVAVALYTFHGHTLPDREGGVDPIDDAGHPKLLVFGSAL